MLILTYHTSSSVTELGGELQKVKFMIDLLIIENAGGRSVQK